MIYHKQYKILPTATFKEEPLLAKRFYQKIIKEINSLTYMPERFQEVNLTDEKNRMLRKMHLSNYIIIYEVKRNTRTSLCFTYIP